MLTGLLVILQLFPPYWLKPYVAINEQETTQQDNVLPPSSEKKQTTDKKHYQGILLTRADIIEMLTDQFVTDGLQDELPTALRVLACESSFNINANNGVSFGIFQFTKPTWLDFGTGDIFNPQTQIRVTAKIVKKEGWGRWDCFTGRR